MAYSLSIVVPIYNSRESVAVLCDKIMTALPNDDIEIILVDDGSEQETWQEIKNIKARFGNKITGIRLSKNFGQHNATICGLTYCSKEYIATIDDDLQHRPDDIPQLIKALTESSNDIVYGIPVVKRQGLSRLVAWYALAVLAWIFNEKISKASAFRLMTKSLANAVKTHQHYFVNLDAVIRWYTVKIGFCTVPHYKRHLHRSGYTTLGLAGLVARILIAYSAVPLKLFLLLFLLALIVGSLLAFCSFILGNAFSWLLPITGVALFAVIAIGFAILFAYLYHLSSYISNKPCYNEAEHI